MSSKLRRRMAFTLVELVVSLLILSLISLIVFTRSTQQLKTARAASFLEQLSIFDHTTRIAARRQQAPMRLTFSLRTREVIRSSTEYGSNPHTIRIPEIIRDVRFRTNRTWHTRSSTEVEVSPNGRTSNYAIRLELDEDRIKYFVAVGATGQTVVLDNESDVDALFN